MRHSFALYTDALGKNFAGIAPALSMKYTYRLLLLCPLVSQREFLLGRKHIQHYITLCVLHPAIHLTIYASVTNRFIKVIVSATHNKYISSFQIKRAYRWLTSVWNWEKESENGKTHGAVFRCRTWNIVSCEVFFPGCKWCIICQGDINSLIFGGTKFKSMILKSIIQNDILRTRCEIILV